MLNRFLSILILLTLCQSAWAGVMGMDRLMRDATAVTAMSMESDSEPCHHSMSTAPEADTAEMPEHPCCDDQQDAHHGHCQHSCHQPLPVSSAIPAALVLISTPYATDAFSSITPQPLAAEPNLPERPPSVA